MNLTELKKKPIGELIKIAEFMGLEGMARNRKQDIIFAILKRHAMNGEEIFGDGVLEILSDGFGFLRSAAGSYLAGPDDIYVSPSQIRRFNLRTGDTITGTIRPPKEGERYFALLKVNQINYDTPENSRNKILFENLTPLFPTEQLIMELGNGTTWSIWLLRLVKVSVLLLLHRLKRVKQCYYKTLLNQLCVIIPKCS